MRLVVGGKMASSSAGPLQLAEAAKSRGRRKQHESGGSKKHQREDSSESDVTRIQKALRRAERKIKAIAVAAEKAVSVRTSSCEGDESQGPPKAEERNDAKVCEGGQHSGEQASPVEEGEKGATAEDEQRQAAKAAKKVAKAKRKKIKKAEKAERKRLRRETRETQTMDDEKSVSYTHLTLPTIYSV